MTARWQTRLAELAREYEVPGASLAVWQDGVLETAATGVINRSTGVATTPDAVFQIGSITKLLTATLMLQLVEEGRAQLDDPLQRHLPEFTVLSRDAAQSITLRHLLSHTSGIDGDFFDSTGAGEDKLARYVDACRLLPQLHEPGELFSYCNAGFNLLGRLIEVQRGTTWETALHRWLNTRLGPNTFVRYPHETPKYRTAIGHVRKDAAAPFTMSDDAYLALASAPAGSVVYASAGDLILLARTIINRGTSPAGEEILKRSTVERMLEPQVRLPVACSADAFGLAFMLWDWDGTQVVGHDGATIGQNAYLRIVPEKNTAVVLLTNGGFPAELYQMLFTEIFDDLLGIHPQPRPRPIAQPPQNLQRYCGVFEKLSQRVSVALREDRLVATVEGIRYPAPTLCYELKAFAGDAFIGALPSSPTPSTFHFLTRPSRARLLMMGTRVHPERLN